MEINLDFVDDIVTSIEKEIDNNSISKQELQELIKKIKNYEIGEINLLNIGINSYKVDLNDNYLNNNIIDYRGTLYRKIKNITSKISLKIDHRVSPKESILFIVDSSTNFIYLNSRVENLQHFYDLYDYFYRNSTENYPSLQPVPTLIFSDIQLAKQIITLKKLYEEATKYIGAGGFKNSFIKP